MWMTYHQSLSAIDCRENTQLGDKINWHPGKKSICRLFTPYSRPTASSRDRDYDCQCERESHIAENERIYLHPLLILSKKHTFAPDKQHYDITMWQTTARAGPSESLIAGVSPNWSFEPPPPVILLCHTSLADETKMIIWLDKKLLGACFAFTKRQVQLGSYWEQDRQKTSKVSAVYFHPLVQPESKTWQDLA